MVTAMWWRYRPRYDGGLVVCLDGGSADSSDVEMMVVEGGGYSGGTGGCPNRTCSRYMLKAFLMILSVFLWLAG